MDVGQAERAPAPASGAVRTLGPATSRSDVRGVGALLLHGLTGSPASMLPWADHLAAAGVTVSVPLLPGHGTSWQDLRAAGWSDWYGQADASFRDLRRRCADVFVMGLSMGGALAIRLAELHVGEVAGLAVVNPSLATRRRSFALLPLLAPVVRSVRGIGDDIRLPGVTEGAYPRVPLRALLSLRDLWAATRADLARVTCPVLCFRSKVDHVVEPLSSRLLLDGVSSTDVTERILPASYHVATLDHDAPTIFAESLAFVRTHARPAAA